MNDKLKLRKRNGSISLGIKIVVSSVLAVVLSYIITSAFNLSDLIKYVVMLAFCIIASVIVSIKPRLVLTVICILVFFIGVSLVLLAQNKEVVSQIGWDVGLLGAGASLVAIAIALYALLIQTERRGENINITDSGRKISNSKKGYVWLEETKKYRCEYCLNFGKYHYCKTLGGIKRHIAKKHE